jgi:hypothetical protein
VSPVTAWATVVILEGAQTRAFQRYTSVALASRAASHEPTVQAAPDHLVVHAGTRLTFEDDELAALVKAAGDSEPDAPRPQQLQDVKRYLANFGIPTTCLTVEGEASAKEEDEKFHARNNGVKKSAAVKRAEAPTPKKKEKKGVKKVVLKGKKNKVKEATRRNGAPADGLGREGTLTRFICERLVKDASDEAILKAARAAFPKLKIGDHYPKWYRGKLKRQGLLKD